MEATFADITNFPISSCFEHAHKNWEIIYLLSGSATVLIGNHEYQIRADDILVLPPNTLHKEYSAEKYTDMYLQADGLDFGGIVLVHEFFPAVAPLMHLMRNVLTEKEDYYRVIASNLLETICAFIKKYDVRNTSYPFVQKIKNIVYENISNPEFSISETLKNTGYNIDYARRCFFRETGFTPKEYLLNLRLSYAKKLLLQDNFISVEWVAFTCGFNDAFYFSALFKKRFGLSPRTYRNRRLLTPQQPLP